MLVIGSMVFHLPHGVGLHLQDQEFRSFLYAIGLECLYTAPTPALNATIQLILLVTTRLGVGAMETGSPGTMPFEMLSL